MKFKTISVIGLGYIGLPTAAMFASRKINVIGVDVVQSTVDIINNGQIHIVEPDLDMIVRSAVDQGFLRAVTNPEPADAFLVAVPTPFKDNHEPDLKFIESATKSIASVLKKGDLVILESTSPVGATEKMVEWMSEIRPDLTFPDKYGDDSDVRVAHCPERVLPGHVMRELIENDRVIGGMSPKCSEVAIELYEIFVTGKCVVTNARTAEMAKLTENSFRDVNIAFANELSLICDKLDINVWELINLTNRHPRVNILNPGPGVGGHCIAVDPWFLISKTPEQAKLARVAREVNDYKPDWVVNKVSDVLREKPQSKVACLGLTFKADIDDVRGSPAVSIVSKLGTIFTSSLLVVEPNLSSLPPSLSGDKLKLVDLDYALNHADVVLILVGHKQFRAINWDKSVNVIDMVGMLDAPAHT